MRAGQGVQGGNVGADARHHALGNLGGRDGRAARAWGRGSRSSKGPQRGRRLALALPATLQRQCSKVVAACPCTHLEIVASTGPGELPGEHLQEMRRWTTNIDLGGTKVQVASSLRSAAQQKPRCRGGARGRRQGLPRA